MTKTDAFLQMPWVLMTDSGQPKGGAEYRLGRWWWRRQNGGIEAMPRGAKLDGLLAYASRICQEPLKASRKARKPREAANLLIRKVY
jgi:hypothetical protein